MKYKTISLYFDIPNITQHTLSICVVLRIPNAIVYKSSESSSKGRFSASACTHSNPKIIDESSPVKII